MNALGRLVRPTLHAPLVLGLAGLAALAGCHSGGFFHPTHLGSGIAAQETRRPGEFDAVRLAVPADAWVRQGPEAEVVLSGDDNLLELIETRVEHGTLVIEMDGSYRSDLGLEVHVTTPRLTGVSIAGSGDVQIEDVDSERLEVSIAGSGDLSAVGRVGRLEASIAGSGDMRLADLEATDVKVSIAGSGDASVHATGTLAASIAGSGDVRYRGDPRLTVSVAGSGEVRGE